MNPQEPPLPLPGSPGGFKALVDAYAAYHAVSRAEVFRRIASVTGNSPNGLRLRYDQRGDRPWVVSAPLGPVFYAADAETTPNTP